MRPLLSCPRKRASSSCRSWPWGTVARYRTPSDYWVPACAGTTAEDVRADEVIE
jgi:hypothetical protein